MKKAWPAHLVALGFVERETYKWVDEIGHVVTTYEMDLRYMVDLLGEYPYQTIAEQVYGWADYTIDIPVFEIEGAMRRLQEYLEKYPPPEHSD